MDLFNDLKKMAQQRLNELGVPYPANADIDTLLLLALNYEFKTIIPHRREIHTSIEFEAKRGTLDAAMQNALGDILKKFKRGHDVNGHLSRSSVNAQETDALRADWNIYHVHISNHKDNPGDKFYARTGPVMFVQITDTDAFFIDIYPHGQGHPETFSRQALLEIIDKNWPKLLEPYKLKGITSVSLHPTDLELKQLRGKGGPTGKKGATNVVLKVGNSYVCSPGGGLATDGTPAANTFRLNRTMHTVKQLENWTNENSLALRKKFSKKLGIPEWDIDFELVSLEGGLGVREINSDQIVTKSGGVSADQKKPASPPTGGAGKSNPKK